ncbi:TlpA disulfide reductase family protein [Clostridium lundense]|uniref:TlpA disulfide reductase family protein n=1 Tax=Clostridium lundense TaxID=319475 RepID=UPI000686F2B8|nr:TlpA disulfide reductase family protein [Clostridium lundense]
MRKKVLFISCMLLIVLAFGVIKYYNKDLSNKKVTIESKNEEEAKKIKAIDFKLVDINGKERTLSEFKGKKVFLNFWATWCGYCKTEMKDIQKLYDETKDKNIVILAVDVGESKDKVKDFIDNNKYTFTVLLDKDQEITKAYGIQGFPTTLFIDEEGYVYSGIQGGMSIDTMRRELFLK